MCRALRNSVIYRQTIVNFLATQTSYNMGAGKAQMSQIYCYFKHLGTSGTQIMAQVYISPLAPRDTNVAVYACIKNDSKLT